jgi:hypothetical protein
MSGLQQISGERVWTELKKILTGRFFDTVMLKMLELNVGQYIGLPENLNVLKFQELCAKSRALNLNLHPIALMSAFVHDEAEVGCTAWHITFATIGISYFPMSLGVLQYVILKLILCLISVRKTFLDMLHATVTQWKSRKLSRSIYDIQQQQ